MYTVDSNRLEALDDAANGNYHTAKATDAELWCFLWSAPE